MRVILTALIALLPAVAGAQSPGDTVEVVVPEDRNCSDFQSQQDAQGWYDAMQIISGADDPHGLDSDGDGQPCESLEWAKVEQVAEGYAIRYELMPAEVTCSMTDAPIQLDDLRSEVVGQTEATIPRRDSIGYDLRWDCLHILHSTATD
jgi:hypothetical protein